MAQRDDIDGQQQNAQRKGGNRTHHQKGDSQNKGEQGSKGQRDAGEHRQAAGGSSAANAR